ncbi:MAG: quercetin 2,3-dioxygenase [Fimbriimonadales bacterium]
MNGDLLSKTLVLLGFALGAYGCTTGEPGAKADSSLKEQTGLEPASRKQDAKPFYRPKGTGPAYWGPGDLYTLLATGEETNDAYFQFEALVPKGGGPPPHIHHGEDETFYLVHGALEMRLGDKTIKASAGDFVNIPRGTVHNFKNVGSDTAVMIGTFVPAGMEKFFQEVFPVAEDRTATPPAITDELIKKMTEAAPRHRVEFVPPDKADKR